MRRLTLLAVLFLAATALPVVMYGQSTLNGLIEDDPSSAEDSTPPQRIGVPQTQMQLSANSSGSLGGYCFDEYLIAPRRVTRFQNVLAGNDDVVVRTADGHTMNLNQAISAGALSVKAMQLQVVFTNRTSGPMAVELRRPVVLWDRPGGSINPSALEALASEDEDYDTRQETIWRYTTGERTLAALGYFNGSPGNIDRAQFRVATEAYQRAHGLTASGDLDEATLDQLSGESNDLRNRLRSLGFRDAEGRSLKEDLAAQIRGYERYMGMTPTGHWSSDKGLRLATDERIIPQVAGLRPDGKPVAETLKGAGTDNILTYLTGLKGFAALVQTPQGVELWGRRGSAVQFQGRGNQAVQRLDDDAAALAVRATRDDRIVLYPRVSATGQSALQVGSRNVAIPAASMKAYLNGGAIPTELAAALSPSVAGGSSETGRRTSAALIVYRGPFAQGRDGAPLAALAKLGMDQADGAALARALDRTYSGRALVYVSDDLRAGANRISETTDHGSLYTPGTSSERFALAR